MLWFRYKGRTRDDNLSARPVFVLDGLDSNI